MEILHELNPMDTETDYTVMVRGVNDETEIELHVFCDASSQAY